MRATGTFTTIKSILGKALFHPKFGSLIASLYSNRIRSNGFEFEVNHPLVTDTRKAMLWWGSYEASDCRFVKKYLNPDLNVVQLGGGMGVIACHMCRVLNEGYKIVCVEANSYMVPLLTKNLEINFPKVSKRIIHGAIDYSDREEIQFKCATDFLLTDIHRDKDGPNLTAPTRTLSSVLEEAGISDYQLQMDIEGGEIGILLKEQPEALSRCKLIIAELHEVFYEGKEYRISDLVRMIEEKYKFKLVDQYGASFVFQRAE